MNEIRNKVKVILCIFLVIIINSCKTKISNSELSAPLEKVLTNDMEKNLAEHIKDGNFYARNKTKKEFNKAKERVISRILSIRKGLLNSYPSYKYKNFILIERINNVVLDYASYLIIDDKILSSRNGKLSSYENLKSFILKKPEMGSFIESTLNNEKPVFYSDGSNPNCYHGCLLHPIVTIVEDGKVVDFYEAEMIK